MKFLRNIGLWLFFCLLGTTGLYADSIPTHFLGLEGHVGYDNLILENKGLRNIGGAGGGIGLVYKMEYRQWRIQTGLEFTSVNSLTKGGYMTSTAVTDPYPTMTLHERYEDIHYDRHLIAFSVPLIAGYRWQDWTFAAGVRVALPLWQTATYDYTLRKTVTDEQLYGEFVDMPNHGLTTSPLTRAVDKTHGLDVQVHAEVIWNLDKWLQYHPKRKSRARKKTFRELLHYEASLFASVGVIDMDPSEDWTRSLFLGGKFSIFYEFEHPKKKKKSSSYHKPASQPSPSSAKPKPQPAPKPKPVVRDTVPAQPDTMYYEQQVVVKGEAVRLNHLYFAIDKTTVLPESKEGLDALYQFLTDNPSVHILIVGHTDNTASERYNLRLSMGRADAVADEMIKRGIDPARLETEGRGESEPVADNNTEEGRQLNRRVEFIVL